MENKYILEKVGGTENQYISKPKHPACPEEIKYWKQYKTCALSLEGLEFLYEHHENVSIKDVSEGDVCNTIQTLFWILMNGLKMWESWDGEKKNGLDCLAFKATMIDSPVFKWAFEVAHEKPLPEFTGSKIKFSSEEIKKE